jgi:hypothetical protein
MSTYLSIDLDYWSCDETSNDVNSFFNKLAELDLSLFVVPHHHQLLSDINNSDCNRLINIDYHSDLADYVNPSKERLDEGTWGNFINFRNKGEFVWIYPHKDCYGDIRIIGSGCCHVHKNPFRNPAVAGWAKTKRKLGKYNKLFNMLPKDIKKIGISYSQDWLRDAPIYDVERSLGIEKWRRFNLKTENVDPVLTKLKRWI